MNKVNSYKELIVWQKSILLTTAIYILLRSFPEDEKFGLASQIRRSVISIPSNIAEGFGRGTTKSFLQFLYISRGSLYELETQLYIAKELSFCQENKEIDNLLLEIGKMLNAMINKLKKNTSEH